MTNSFKVNNYSAGAKFLHWTIALIVIALLSVSFFLEDIPAPYRATAFTVHKSLGLTVLALMIVRLMWIMVVGKPKLPNTVPYWQKLIARTVQYAFYLFLIAMPLSGWIMSVAADKAPKYFGLFTLSLPFQPNKPLARFMNETHEVIAWILIALLALHLLGAIKHYFIDKDDVVQRMFPKCRSKHN